MIAGEQEYMAWVRYADDDLKAAEELIKAGLYNLACFHSHQAAEKYLKAFLVKHRINPPRIHKLPVLVGLCQQAGAEIEELKEDALILDMYYIPTRYPTAPVGSLPEGLPNEDDAKKALDIAKRVRDFVKVRERSD
ncbi:HEPN domain-containing protein [Thermanaeromonas toyohensis ToBE]|uniref:HEPN domain-containing protein n=1 Tax=Thermanaeromonas toyohensis ToBE TaxID=698762 RepID=A0A1W1VR40_9FIRM|nr:HEPN domain-containing protein [Thermanaeromonas toyohensis]SMB95842.1 HEPN domain-containing protein [Thermanaeromonas toyohensis ToBE]